VEQKIIDWFFSRTNVIIHTLWFGVWFVFRLNINLLTLVVSLEAIYITIALGIAQKHTENKLKKHINDTTGGKK